MAIVPVQPLVMKDVDAIFGADVDAPDFRKHLDAITYTPTAAQASWTGLGANTHTDVATALWALVLSYVQDWDSAESLSRFLFEHEGETIPVEFRPRTGSGASFASNVVITPGAIGGAVNAFATTSVTLGSDKPVPTWTPAG